MRAQRPRDFKAQRVRRRQELEAERRLYPTTGRRVIAAPRRSPAESRG